MWDLIDSNRWDKGDGVHAFTCRCFNVMCNAGLTQFYVNAVIKFGNKYCIQSQGVGDGKSVNGNV